MSERTAELWLRKLTLPEHIDRIDTAIGGAEINCQKQVEIEMFTLASWQKTQAVTFGDFGKDFDMTQQIIHCLVGADYTVGVEIRSCAYEYHDHEGDTQNTLVLIITWL